MVQTHFLFARRLAASFSMSISSFELTSLCRPSSSTPFSRSAMFDKQRQRNIDVNNAGEQDHLPMCICDNKRFVIKRHGRESSSAVVPHGSASYKLRYLADMGCLSVAEWNIPSSKLQPKPRAVPLGITTLFWWVVARAPRNDLQGLVELRADRTSCRKHRVC